MRIASSSECDEPTPPPATTPHPAPQPGPPSATVLVEKLQDVVSTLDLHIQIYEGSTQQFCFFHLIFLLVTIVKRDINLARWPKRQHQNGICWCLAGGHHQRHGKYCGIYYEKYVVEIIHVIKMDCVLPLDCWNFEPEWGTSEAVCTPQYENEDRLQANCRAPNLRLQEDWRHLMFCICYLYSSESI